jgi:hypothetical protein
MYLELCFELCGTPFLKGGGHLFWLSFSRAWKNRFEKIGQ